MFGWRKKRDGFEWQSYVRTTILMRRKERRRKVVSAMAAASEQLAQAGRQGAAAGVSGLKSSQIGLRWTGARLAEISWAAWRQVATFSQIAFWASLRFLAALWKHTYHYATLGAAYLARFAVSAWDVIRRGVNFVAGAGRKLAARAAKSAWRGLKSGSIWIADFILRCTQTTWRGLARLVDAVADRGIVLHIALASAVTLIVSAGLVYAQGIALQNLLAGLLSLFGFGIAGASALQSRGRHRRSSGFTHSANIIANIRARLARIVGDMSWPEWLRFSLPSGTSRVAAVVACLVIFGAGAWWAVGAGGLLQHSLSSMSVSTSDVIKGRARVLSGDTLKIKGNIIKLSGVDAPERRQKCSKPGAKRWACGETARQALRRVVRRRSVTCEVSAKDDSGHRDGSCRVKGEDIAALMVRKGYAFSSGGWFTKYAGLEAEARRETAGLWRGTAQRPEDYRAERWQDASAKAPEGCPIKGRVLSRRKKVYVLPWSRNYERTRVRPRRGERWFCSEAEALRAGWKPFDHS